MNVTRIVPSNRKLCEMGGGVLQRIKSNSAKTVMAVVCSLGGPLVASSNNTNGKRNNQGKGLKEGSLLGVFY